ncbi:MAG TPA: hypothetical protein VIB99_03215 [Candidatus Limnocylindrales bacterium]|jgi:hypothetical protein
MSLDRGDDPQGWSGSVGRRSSRGILTATGLVAVLGLLGVVAINQLAGPTRTSTPGRTPAPIAGSLPSSILGLPVISVDAAQRAPADSSVAGAELAVGGWYTAQREEQPCQPSPQPAGTCVSDWTAFLDSAPDPAWNENGSLRLLGKGFEFLNPVFLDPVERPGLSVTTSNGAVETVPPTAVVLVGHFHDDRLANSLAFVVDAVADQAGVLAPDSVGLVPSTQLSSGGVTEQIRANLKGGAVVLGFGAMPWAAGDAGASALEPPDGGPPADGRTVWLVRGYLPDSGATPSTTTPPAPLASTPAPLASWLAIDDATGQIWGPMAAPAVATDLPPHIPSTIDGLPVKTVAAALPTEAGRSPLLAIGGYLSNDRAPEGCPPAPTTDKPDPCSGTQLVLVDRPISVLQPDDATFLYVIAVPPGAAFIRPVILPGTSAADPWALAIRASDRESPRPVVLVGQFGDPRSPECAPRPGGGSAGCDRSFVVDQIAWIDGVSQDPSVYLQPGQALSHGSREVSQAVSGWFLPGAQPAVVSITATTTADSAGLTGVNLDERKPGLVWVVRVVSSLADGPASSSLVFDDQDLALVAVSP